jgi:heme-degrading monooxygenase HmoA
MSDKIATTPTPPYYAVIFTSLKRGGDNGYAEMADKMLRLAQQQEGFLGFESARTDIGISVSYWLDLTAIQSWKLNAEHTLARQKEKDVWYEAFRARICKVEREYGHVE